MPVKSAENTKTGEVVNNDGVRTVRQANLYPLVKVHLNKDKFQVVHQGSKDVDNT